MTDQQQEEQQQLKQQEQQQQLDQQQQHDDDWDDLLGTGTILKRILVAGQRSDDDHEMIEATYQRDLFPGAHLVIPLMDINEKSRYIFDSKFGYGSLGNKPDIGCNAKLDCTITLKFRTPYDDFITLITPGERLKLAIRKKDRGKFWYLREDYQNALTIYQNMKDLCLLEIS